MFTLVLDPDGPKPRRLPVAVTAADVEDAIDYGRAERGNTPEQQQADAAYHLVMEGRVCGIDELHDGAWVLMRGDDVVAHNAAITVR